MRVALVTENFLPKLDGVTRTLAMLLEHLQKRGHQALVVGPEGAPRRYAGARIFGAHGLPLPFYPELRALLPEPVFERRLAMFRPQVIHVVEPMILGAAGITWGQRLGVPIVSSYHTNLAAYCNYFGLGALVEPTWLYRRYLHNQCARTLCPSPSTGAQLISRGFTHVGLWPRGVDTQLFTPTRRSTSWRQEVADNENRTIILYVGRLSHEKNLMALVSAYLAVEKASTQLVLVGDGPARADLERALAGHQATFTGYLRGEALAQAYASADVFAFPSTTETFGQVVNEAMASGLPVVAFDAEGVRDQVRHGETGFLAPNGDQAAFTQLLRLLIEAKELRQCVGAEAHHLAGKRTWESVMDGLLEVYRSVANGTTIQQAAYSVSLAARDDAIVQGGRRQPRPSWHRRLAVADPPTRSFHHQS